LTVAIWGVGPVFLRSLSVALGAADHLVIRFSLVTILYAGGLAILGNWRIARADWPRLLAISLLGMLGYNLGSAFGFELVPAGIGGLIIGTQPLLIALLAAAVTHEKLTLYTGAGLAVAFIGTALLFRGDLAQGEANTPVLLGALFVFLSGVAWAFYVVVSKPLVRAYGAYTITAISIATATLPMILGLASAETIETVRIMTARNWLEMAFMIVFSTFLATITWNYGAARLSAAATGATLYFVPVIAVAAGAIMLDELITRDILLGGLLIIAGVAVAQIGPRLRKLPLDETA
jgi:drug/metabolite transporter (DMT)-like permease